MESRFADAALRYVRMGLCVIPLYPNTKKPMFDNWPDVASKDAAIVSRWWQQNPNANVGIATGIKSGVFVLDVDPKNGGEETFDSLVMKHGRVPDTWQQITGSGGFHLFFRYPNFKVGNSTGIWPGIDIRGDGGQVAAPPSIHPDTHRTYEWDGLKEIEQTELAEAPDWVLEAIQSKSRLHSDKLPITLEIPQGVRHDTFVALAGAMRRLGLETPEIVATLREINDRRCHPSVGEDEIQTISASMMRYRPADKDLFQTATRLWRVTRAREIEQEEKRAESAVKVIDGLSVYRSPASEQVCVVENLLYNGLTILAGKPKCGKSWLTLQLALSVATGSRLLGAREVYQPGRVLYAALEESEARTSTRMHKLQAVEEPALQNITMTYRLNPLMSGGFEQLAQLVQEHRPSLVIVDTLLALVGGQSDKNNVMRSEYREVQILQQLAHRQGTETAIVLVHHTRKMVGNEQGVDAVAGSRGVTAAADAIWTLRREDEDTSLLEITGRETEEQALALKFGRGDEVGWTLIGDGAEVKNLAMEKEIMLLLQNEGAANPSRVATLLRMNANAIRSCMYELYRRGLLERDSKGGYSMGRVPDVD